MVVEIRREPEITSPVLLCDEHGRLRRDAVGWSRHPLHTCNLPDTLPRKKRWNYWCVTSGDVLLSATVADIDFVALAFVYVFDIATHYFAEYTVIAPPGPCAMPETPRGDIVFEHPKMRVALTDEGAGTRIRVDCADFHGEPLTVDIAVERPRGHETLNVVIPWSDTEFQFTSKQNCLPASGTVTLGERAWGLSAPAFGCLDFGRGVWPAETLWNWGAGSGVQGDHVVGLNLGGRWTDGTGMTENALCVDGRLTKIGEDLAFDYDRADLNRQWAIRSANGDRVQLTFTPIYERIAAAKNDAYSSEVHQLFGHYDGTIVADDVGALEVRDLFGWIEDHAARW